MLNGDRASVPQGEKVLGVCHNYVNIVNTTEQYT